MNTKMKLFLKDLFTKNLGIKIVILFLAAILWIYVSTAQNKVDFFPGRIPIEVQKVPSGLSASLLNNYVTIKISAPKSVWSTLSADSFSAYVDVENAKQGIYHLEVQVKSNVPGVQILEKNPAKVYVTIEPLVTKEVPIVVKIKGGVLPGFIVTEKKVNLKKALVSGPKSIIENLKNAIALVNLLNEQEDVKKEVDLVVLDKNNEPIPNINFEPRQVEVTIKIRPASNIKAVGVKPILDGQVASGFWIKKVAVIPSVIIISGDPADLENISFLETEKINIKDLSKDKVFSDVKLNLPEKVIVQDEIKTVKVEIILSPVISTKTVPATITFQNLGSDLKISSTDISTLTVVLSGPLNILQNINSSDVVINIDLSNKEEGQHKIDISKEMITIPEDTTIVNFSPTSMVVMIEKK